MDITKKSITTARGAKDYLSKNEIPQLFECLMTGLMYNRPDDYIEYLQECLEKIKKQGVSAVKWDMFLEAKKTPLPPIQSAPKEDFRPEPLPEIGSYKLNIASDSKIILLLAGPGMNKNVMAHDISIRFSDFQILNMGELLRGRVKTDRNMVETKFPNAINLMEQGHLAPAEFAIDTLIAELNKYKDRKNFIIQGYPRSMEEKDDFERFISITRVTLFLLIDSEEELCLRLLNERRNIDGWTDHNPTSNQQKITQYKTLTLQTCKFFDDLGKLRLINGDVDRSRFMSEALQIIEAEHFKIPCQPEPSKSSLGHSNSTEKNNVSMSPIRGVTEIIELTGIPSESERDPNLPEDLRIILLVGGPGSGKSEIANIICQKNSEFVHVNLNELLRSKIINSSEPDRTIAIAMDEETPDFTENWKWNSESVKQQILEHVSNQYKVVILEGYPRFRDELSDMNVQVGSIDAVVLLDSEEETMRNRLQKRYEMSGLIDDCEENVDRRIAHFKENGLSICRYYDERSRLNIINSDGDIMKIADEVISIILPCTERNDVPILDDEPENAPETAVDENNNVLEYGEAEVDAIVKIQAGIRGHLVRKHANENDETEEDQIVAERTSPIEAISYAEDADNPEIEEKQDDNETEKVDEKTIDETENDEIKDDNEVEEIIEPEQATVLGHKGVRTESQMKMNDATLILLLGGPGCGKKSIGDQLVSRYAISFIHVDQLFKSEAEKEEESEFSEALKHYLENSEDVDLKSLMTILRRELSKLMESSSKIVIAGFPKTMEQLNVFEHDIGNPAMIIHIDVDKETMKSRLEQESDPDTNEEVNKRIELFSEQFQQILESIESSDKYKKIIGSQDIDAIMNELDPILSDVLKESEDDKQPNEESENKEEPEDAEEEKEDAEDEQEEPKED